MRIFDCCKHEVFRLKGCKVTRVYSCLNTSFVNFELHNFRKTVSASVKIDISWDSFNPNQAGGGWNLPEATLTACRCVLDGVRTVKPSCNFHFRCLKSFYEKKLGGCKKKFLKNLRLKFFFRRKLKKKFFWNPIFSKNFIHNSTFWHQIWIQNDFSFHLICILSM